MKLRRSFYALDDLSAAYITARAEAVHKEPSEIIGELVREKIAAIETPYGPSQIPRSPPAKFPGSG
ncbi:hypothetical protein AGMMS49942_08940 [Spirochaetia bacterium]|nr:hypothetical protein AGMMS49942_08940 [Spirochaetia bacterium]